MNTVPAMSKVVFFLLAICMVTGCQAFQMSIKNVDPEKASPLTANYDQGDLKGVAQSMCDSILAAPFPPAGDLNPIVVELGIKNSTEEHLDMKALADTLTTKMLNTGKVRFIDASTRDSLLKEQGYQLANCTSATQAKIGKQLGAKYMLSGAMTQITSESGREVRVSKKQDIYYQLTVKITDLESGLVVVSKQIDRMRRASKPIIGW
jgi:uncharacterized protein (TIGR02722 family)